MTVITTNVDCYGCAAYHTVYKFHNPVVIEDVIFWNSEQLLVKIQTKKGNHLSMHMIAKFLEILMNIKMYKNEFLFICKT